jgi:hypothetical protein
MHYIITYINTMNYTRGQFVCLIIHLFSPTCFSSIDPSSGRTRYKNKHYLLNHMAIFVFSNFSHLLLQIQVFLFCVCWAFTNLIFSCTFSLVFHSPWLQLRCGETCRIHYHVIIKYTNLLQAHFVGLKDITDINMFYIMQAFLYFSKKVFLHMLI